MSLRLATALPELAWEARLVSAFDRGEHGVTVARRTVDTVELLAVSAAGLVDVAVVSAALPHVDAATIADLQRFGVAVVLAVPASEVGPASLGQDAVVPQGLEAPQLVGALRAAVEAAAQRTVPSARTGAAFDGTGRSDRTGGPGPAGWDATSGGPAPGSGHGSREVSGTEVLASHPSHPAAHPAGQSQQSRQTEPSAAPARVVAVWGPTGAPGRTTVAATLAELLASRGVRTTLVDADTYGGAVAQSLGLLDDGSGLLEACRDAGAGRLDAATLSHRTRVLPSGLRVLTGFARADRWPEASGPLVRRVLDACRSLSTVTVVDCGFCLEEDEALSYDTAAPQRNGATLAALRSAEAVVAVCAPDPVALQRFVRSLDDLRKVTDAPLYVVLNGVDQQQGPTGEPVAVLERFAAVVPVAEIPFDRPTMARALAEGRSPAEVAPRSRLVEEVGRLAVVLAGDVAEGGEGRARGIRRRLRWGRGSDARRQDGRNRQYSSGQSGAPGGSRPTMPVWTSAEGRTTAQSRNPQPGR